MNSVEKEIPRWLTIADAIIGVPLVVMAGYMLCVNSQPVIDVMLSSSFSVVNASWPLMLALLLLAFNFFGSAVLLAIVFKFGLFLAGSAGIVSQFLLFFALLVLTGSSI